MVLLRSHRHRHVAVRDEVSNSDRDNVGVAAGRERAAVAVEDNAYGS